MGHVNLLENNKRDNKYDVEHVEIRYQREEQEEKEGEGEQSNSLYFNDRNEIYRLIKERMKRCLVVIVFASYFHSIVVEWATLLTGVSWYHYTQVSSIQYSWKLRDQTI
ncbi:hypothetical protein KQX54_016589 [Cotesia glomerata]|uniref:Uncharacterized protein n=1 Tax=Cotesia glomerata TaxID=32391 RepID=A0AAV7ICA4_COTGL|nr:hypothetical protein KQX54_016589 [Cotesia glomerata]